jgi:steroid delta-isomerase-like uncharacterized protein
MHNAAMHDNGNARLIEQFMARVWNAGDVDAVDDFLGARYAIHSDPGDPWDGRELTRDDFKQRLVMSRAAFPDLGFELDEMVAGEDRVALSWTMRGKQTGALAERPASGRPIEARGMTIYYIAAGRITGHRQVVDRLAVAQQLGFVG